MSKPPNPDLVRRILEVALEELDEKPPAKVNMRTIAQKVGVSATAIYYYFPSKEALFERIKFDAMAELDGRVSQAVGRGRGPRERLVALIREYAAWCLERYNLARLVMDELPPNLDLDEEAMQKYYGIFFRARDLVEEAVATGAIAERDVLLEVSVAQAAIWGIVSLFKGKRIHPQFWDSMDPMIDRFIELSFESKGEER
jgi:TetR/AcrR family transcriptional regulator